MQAVRDEHAKQKHAWASAKKVLQAQQSSLQDECNDLACQLAEQDQQLRRQDEQIKQLKKQLREADVTVISRGDSEVNAHSEQQHCFVLPPCVFVCLFLSD